MTRQIERAVVPHKTCVIVLVTKIQYLPEHSSMKSAFNIVRHLGGTLLNAGHSLAAWYVTRDSCDGLRMLLSRLSVTYSVSKQGDWSSGTRISRAFLYSLHGQKQYYLFKASRNSPHSILIYADSLRLGWTDLS
jgi:hypothetical protein